jgi:hypothetical protein
MSDNRRGVKLDFTSDIPNLPIRPKVDPQITATSVVAAQEVGFLAEQGSRPVSKPLSKPDGRRLRRRGLKVQMNIKVSEEEKEVILSEAEGFIRDQSSNIRTIGEFVVHVVDLYRKQKAGGENRPEE